MPPVLTPMRLRRIPQPFDYPHFLYEPKIDGFRALAHIRGHHGWQQTGDLEDSECS